MANELPRLPELPEANTDWDQWECYTAAQYRAGQLAAWRAGMEYAAALCDQMRDRALDCQRGPPDDASNIMLRQIAHLGNAGCAAAIRQSIDPLEGLK